MKDEKIMNNENTTVQSAAPAAAIENPDAFKWYRENPLDDISDGLETVYPNTGVTLQRFLRHGADRIYQNFAIAYNEVFGKNEKGEDIIFPQVINFRPVNQDKGDLTFDVLSFIYGDKVQIPVAIVKTVSPKTDTRPETISWGLRLVHTLPDGGDIAYDFTPSTSSDRRLFNTNFIGYLKRRGLVK